MEDRAISVVVELPSGGIACRKCINHLEGPLGLFCGIYKEEILFETVALECGDFEHGF